VVFSSHNIYIHAHIEAGDGHKDNLAQASGPGDPKYTFT
jgi:hypothetical protein